MKTFEVLLTKSYTVKIKALNEDEAKRNSEYFTGDIKDISNEDDRAKNNFNIKEIVCVQNDSFQAT